LSDERYRPGYLNEGEFRRDQQRVEEMVRSFRVNTDSATQCEGKAINSPRIEAPIGKTALIGDLISALKHEKEKSILDR